MRSEVKANLLQALGASFMVEPLDENDRLQLHGMQCIIKAALRDWDEYENGTVTTAHQESE